MEAQNPAIPALWRKWILALSAINPVSAILVLMAVGLGPASCTSRP